jgi:hypothetical protein
MPEPKVNEFSNHICALCATRGTDVFRLGAKLGIDPMELLQIIPQVRLHTVISVPQRILRNIPASVAFAFRVSAG